MPVISTTYNGNKDRRNDTAIKIAGRRNVLSRLGRFLKSSVPDENISAVEMWFNRICRISIGLSAVYFLSALILR